MSNLVRTSMAMGRAPKRLFIRHDSQLAHMSREWKRYVAARFCNSKMLASFFPRLYSTAISPIGSPSPASPESSGSSSICLPALRCGPPHRFSDHRLRQSHHSRRRPLFLQLVWPHHHDSRRHTRRTPGPAPVYRLFLVETRNYCRGLLELLVLRKLPLHRYLHGRRAHVRICRWWARRKAIGRFSSLHGACLERTNKSAQRPAPSAGWACSPPSLGSPGAFGATPKHGTDRS